MSPKRRRGSRRMSATASGRPCSMTQPERLRPTFSAPKALTTSGSMPSCAATVRSSPLAQAEQAVRGAHHPVHAARHLGQQLGQVQPLHHAAPDLEQRLQLVAAPAHVLQQAGVAEGDGDVAGHRLDEAQVLGAKGRGWRRPRLRTPITRSFERRGSVASAPTSWPLSSTSAWMGGAPSPRCHRCGSAKAQPTSAAARSVSRRVTPPSDRHHLHAAAGWPGRW